jgi:hypothetical protein
MSEIPNASMDDLVAQEKWAEATAEYISKTFETKVGYIEYEIALKAARFACLWVDEFKAITEGGEEVADRTPKAVIRLAEERAQLKAEGLDRYPTGVPTLKTIMASWYAFAAAFGSESDQVFAILTTPSES